MESLQTFHLKALNDDRQSVLGFFNSLKVVFLENVVQNVCEFNSKVVFVKVVHFSFDIETNLLSEVMSWEVLIEF